MTPELPGPNTIPAGEITAPTSPIISEVPAHLMPTPDVAPEHASFLDVSEHIGAKVLEADGDSNPFLPSEPLAPNPPMQTFGGYAGQRMSQMPGAQWRSGMPVTGNMLTSPQQGDPLVPNLGPGDPRNS
jgi:hypothetical protein